MFSLNDNSLGILILLGAVGFLPLVAVTITAFAKVSVVLLLVRNALGLQQVPPNIIVYGLSVIISAFVAVPLANEAMTAVKALGLGFRSLDEWMSAFGAAREPLAKFLLRFIDPKQLEFFHAATQRVWNGSYSADRNDLVILVPSFLMSELTRAFVMGFTLYLPFMAIDVIVTTILVALGMSMVQPTTISIPFKLMLFVFLDGWTRIIQGLVMSYSA